MKTLIERLEYAIETHDTNRSKLSLDIGKSKDTIRKILEGSTRDPSAETLRLIAEKLDINLLWLITGDGNMNLTSKNDVDLLQLVGYVDAGVAELYIDQSVSQIEAEYLPYKDGNKYIGFQVRGPSMRPRFLEGEILVFYPPQPYKELINAEVYITLKNGSRLIKILKNNPNGGYLLVSHNPAFPDIEIQGEDILETRKFRGIY